MATDNPLLRALRGKPSMRRRLAGLDSARANEISQHFEGRDGRRDRSFIRRDLEAILRNEQAAAPILRRQQLQDRIADPRTSRDALPTLRRQLANDPSRPGTVNASRNPLRWGSVARQRFGSLYRNL